MNSLSSRPIAWNDAGFAEMADRIREPDWALDVRRAAWRSFQELPWPSARSEGWNRTDIRAFRLEKFRATLDAPEPVACPEGLLREGVDLAGDIVSINGLRNSGRLDPRWEKRGVLFTTLDRLTRPDADRMRPHVETHRIDPAVDRFAALQAAFGGPTRVLLVPRGCSVEQPLLAMSVVTPGGVDLGRTVIVLEDGAEATVLLETASLAEDDEGLHSGLTDVVLGAGANLRLVHLQNWGDRVWHFAHQKAVVGRGARLQWTVGTLGARLAKVNQHVDLVGPGATCEVNGVLFTEGTQHLAYHTEQRHAAPSCRSDFLYKAALQDRSRTVWRGMIRVERNARKSDGYQRIDNLLLSPEARADSIPGLEIEADDVRCTHGSTTSRFDDEPIFYAQCRGLTRNEAIRTYVVGFFQQVLDRITVDSVREALGRAIARRVRETE
ncbi:MAG: Fe-S cluster assembly protein SufD [Planctomycetes bacterium]|nr:Fe-S cluster assembly protein SufD [Planctomycetota bacterium]